MQDVTVIFDLDGTLVDTAPDLLNSLDHVVGKAGLPPVNRHAIRDTISLGARAMIDEAFRRQDIQLAAPRLDKLFAEFIEFYQHNIAVDSRPFPGVTEVLELFQQRGTKLAVCTNKREALSKQLLAELGLTKYFRALAGADTFAFRKPDPAHLLETIRMVSGDPSASVMVGDSGTDIKTAKAAGVPVVAVDFGYSSIPVSEYDPDALISHFDELPPVVALLTAK